MRIRFMFHKAVSLVCFMIFISMHFVHEGYPQAQTEQNVSLEEQKEGRTLLVTAATLYGLSLYGPGIARLLEIESGSQIAGLEMLIGGGSFAGRACSYKESSTRRGTIQANPIGQFRRDPIRFGGTRVI